MVIAAMDMQHMRFVILKRISVTPYVRMIVSILVVVMMKTIIHIKLQHLMEGEIVIKECMMIMILTNFAVKMLNIPNVSLRKANVLTIVLNLVNSLGVNWVSIVVVISWLLVLLRANQIMIEMILERFPFLNPHQNMNLHILLQGLHLDLEEHEVYFERNS